MSKFEPVVRSDEEAEDPDNLHCNPFHQKWSVWRWDDDYRDQYHRIRRGDDEIIELVERRADDTRRRLAESHDRLDEAHEALPEGAWEFVSFKLAETRYHLDVMTAAKLAWLTASGHLYDGADDLRGPDVEIHLETLRELETESGESTTVQWLGETHDLERGAWVDIGAFRKQFRDYWG
jgi:hypothetical protein